MEKENTTNTSGYAKITIVDTEAQRIDGVAMNHPYNLKMTIRQKVHDCHKKLKYTAFMNNRGNLCHVVDPNNHDDIIRLVFKPPIKDLDPLRQLVIIWERLSKKVNVGPCPTIETRSNFVWPNQTLDGKFS